MLLAKKIRESKTKFFDSLTLLNSLRCNYFIFHMTNSFQNIPVEVPPYSEGKRARAPPQDIHSVGMLDQFHKKPSVSRSFDLQFSLSYFLTKTSSRHSFRR